MKNLKHLCVAIALTLTIALSAFAGEIPSPPCAPPDPGEIPSPPCSVAQNAPDDSTVPGLTNSPPSVVISDEYSVGELAIEIAQHWLSIY
jgi:hypothetical protein